MSEEPTMGASCADHCPLAAGESRSPGVDRREFLLRASLFAAAAALAACTGVGDNATGPANVSTSIKVSDYPALANVGGVALINVSGSPLAVVRTGDTSFDALSRICPHQGATVDHTYNGFQCPRHGATFTNTGTWTGGQRTGNLHAYTTSYDAGTGILKIG